MYARSERRIARPAVDDVWAFLIHVADGRMMTDLFIEDMRPICHLTLESLAEDRIEWLVKDVARLEEAERVSHDELHTFNWICGKSS